MSTNLKDLKLLTKGKVRDVYDLDDKLLIVASDRISAFDFVLPTLIPDKGKVLTKISTFWFNLLEDVIENHLISSDVEEYPDFLKVYKDDIKDRSMFVRRAKRIDLECIVRGYITGSGWKDYQNSGSICGIKLKEGLKESEALDEPIFTPSTKAEIGDHDENISFDHACDIVGKELALKLKEISLKLYKKASIYAETKGIIIADTKFEFGICDNKIILIDEVFTPDSSRFWDKEKYTVGVSQDSFDKQYIRDYLLNSDWNREAPVPDLPDEVVKNTQKKYEEAYNRLAK